MNRDLWEDFVDIKQYASEGIKISFWHIPRNWNGEADHYAKIAATHEPDDFYA